MTDFLKTDFEKLSASMTYDALPVGEYEVNIKNVEERVSISGNQGISFQLEVRRGLNTEAELAETNKRFGGRVFFTSVWESERNPKYKEETLNIIAINAGASDKQQFKTFADFKEFVTGKQVRVNVTHDLSMYRGESRVQEQVAPWDWQPTHYVMEVM